MYFLHINDQNTYLTLRPLKARKWKMMTGKNATD